MPKPPSKKKVKNYVKSGGTVCPSCGADDITGDSWEADAGFATQEVSCSACDFSWKDLYKLVGIEAA